MAHHEPSESGSTLFVWSSVSVYKVEKVRHFWNYSTKLVPKDFLRRTVYWQYMYWDNFFQLSIWTYIINQGLSNEYPQHVFFMEYPQHKFYGEIRKHILELSSVIPQLQVVWILSGFSLGFWKWESLGSFLKKKSRGVPLILLSL